MDKISEDVNVLVACILLKPLERHLRPSRENCESNLRINNYGRKIKKMPWKKARPLGFLPFAAVDSQISRESVYVSSKVALPMHGPKSGSILVLSSRFSWHLSGGTRS
jgi:hypothetical protein